MKSGSHLQLVFLAVALKLALLLAFGPLQQPDSGMYIAYAELILKGGEWSHQIDLHFPHASTFRMIGYPAVIATFQAVFGSYWDWALVTVQSAAGLLTMTLVFRAGRLITGSGRLGCVAAGLYLLSPALQLDLFVLTDSLYGHLLAILTALLVIWSCEDRRVTVARVLGCGLLLALAMVIRSATMPLGLLFVAPFTVWVWKSGLKTGALMLVLFLLPLMTVDQGYKAWNKARGGEAFLTTDTMFALLQPLIVLEAKGVPAFAGQTVLDRSAREVFALENGPSKATMVTDAFAIGERLTKEGGLSTVEALALVKKRFFETMLAAPAALLAHTGRELSSSVLFSPFDPLRVLRRLVSYRYDLDRWLDARHAFLSRPLSEWSVSGVVYLVLEAVSRAVALVLLLGFLAAGPGAVPAMIGGDRTAGMRVALVVLAAGFIVATAMIHLEERYIIGVFPALFLASLATLPDLGRRCSHWLFRRDRSFTS